MAIGAVSIAAMAVLSIAGATSYTCLGDQKTNITFKNTGELVPDLWQGRIITSGYVSQHAVDYMAYIFMTEKLGMNVTFWPFAENPHWYSTYTVDNMTLSYPTFWFQFIENDYADFQFEVWPTQEASANATSFYADGTVSKGINGVFGEIGWFLPKYFVDEYPTAVVPEVLATDATIRELLINGSMYGTTNYYDVYKNSTTFSTQFDYADRMQANGDYYPIVWGPAESYLMSQYSWDLTRNLDLNLSFVATGSEGKVFALVEDLYEQELPFIANIYIPDDNFAKLANTSTGFQQFEKIALPFNSAQSVYADCWQNSECQQPLEALRKIKNPMIDDRFPEMASFFSGFEITADQLALLTSYYTSINDSSMSEHEKWVNASCSWLKDPDSADIWDTDGWLIDIERYDCIPGCGFETTGGDYIGGTCDYLTPTNGNGTCECDDDRLNGDRCDETCPGTDSAQMSNGTWYVEYCSGHGSCSNFQCTCDQGYGGNGCQKKYSTFTFNSALGGIIIALSAILAISGIGSVVWLRMNATYKTVKALSVDMTTLFTIGLIMLAMSNVPLVTPVTDASCCAWQFLFGVGGILSIMSPLLKAYRVSRVFHGGKMLRSVKITDKMLMKILLKALVAEIAICVGYTAVHQTIGEMGTETYYNDELLRKEPRCNQASMVTYFSLGSYAYFFIMLCTLTYYSYGTRRALSVFKESTCAYFSSFLSMFCTLITFGFNAATDDPLFRNTVQAIAVIIVVTEVLVMFYGTRIYTFFTQPENRNVTDGRSISSTTTASTTGNFANNAAPPAPGPQHA